MLDASSTLVLDGSALYVSAAAASRTAASMCITSSSISIVCNVTSQLSLSHRNVAACQLSEYFCIFPQLEKCTAGWKQYNNGQLTDVQLCAENF